MTEVVEGPIVNVIVERLCEDWKAGKECSHHTSEKYCCQDDRGYNRYCNHPSVGKKYIGETDKMPEWCPQNMVEDRHRSSGGSDAEINRLLPRFQP